MNLKKIIALTSLVAFAIGSPQKACPTPFKNFFIQVSKKGLRKIKQLREYKTLAPQHNLQPIETLVSSRHDLIQRIVTEIDAAQDRILIAVYLITNDKIIEALLRTQERAQKYQQNIDIQIVTDILSIKLGAGKADQLSQSGITTKIFPFPSNQELELARTGSAPKKWTNEPLMHHKFLIIDDKAINGSLNLTQKGNNENYENIMIIHDKKALQCLLTEFCYLASHARDLDPLAPSDDTAEVEKLMRRRNFDGGNTSSSRRASYSEDALWT